LIQNFLALIMVRRTLGFWTWPTKNSIGAMFNADKK